MSALLKCWLPLSTWMESTAQKWAGNHGLAGRLCSGTSSSGPSHRDRVQSEARQPDTQSGPALLPGPSRADTWHVSSWLYSWVSASYQEGPVKKYGSSEDKKDAFEKLLFCYRHKPCSLTVRANVTFGNAMIVLKCFKACVTAYDFTNLSKCSKLLNRIKEERLIFFRIKSQLQTPEYSTLHINWHHPGSWW